MATTILVPLGNDVSIPFQASTPTNISGWTIRFQIRQRGSSSAALVTKSGAAITITDPVLGIFEVALASADTQGMTAGYYYYCAERIDATHRQLLEDGTIQLQYPKFIA